MASLRSLKSIIYEREERKLQYQSHIRGLNAYERHKKFVKDYVEFYGKDKRTDVKLSIRTDQDTLREGYRFIPSEEDDLDSSWEKRLVKKYYDKLFKEYCIADMSQYKKGKIGLRWRMEKEVISGKGQFICGNRECNEKDGLGSYEVNFSYFEAGENKQALVKLVACKRCAEKLIYKRQKDEEARMEEERKLEEKILTKEGKKDKHKWERDSDKVDNEPSNECDRISRPKGSSKSDDKPSDGHHRSSRKKGSRKADDGSSDEYDRSSRKKGRKSSSSHGEAKEDEDFDDFLVGMFP